MTEVVLRVERLALHARHGVNPEERALGQHFFIDLVATVEVGETLGSDRLEDGVNYAELIEAASAAFTANAFNLIETAAAVLAGDLIRRFARLTMIEVTVHKPSAPVKAHVADISATVVRRRHG
jgi:dihydroneopterin aldolase